MVRLIEVRETISDSDLLENVYEINKLSSKLIRTLGMIESLDITDFNYFNIVVAKCKRNLEKIYELI